MDIWLVGHAGCYNRGCEAIVRTTVAMLRDASPHLTIRLLSHDPAADAVCLADLPIEIVDGSRGFYSSFHARGPISKFRRYLLATGPTGLALARRWLQLRYGAPRVMISVGGDNFSLDYGIPVVYVDHGRQSKAFAIPFVIWGASVGPFSASPEVEAEMTDFLKGVTRINARESETLSYLASRGISQNVRAVWDPAFALEAAPYDGPGASFVENGNVVGLNISALIAKWFPQQSLDRLLDEVAGFVEYLVGAGYRVLLVPHVTKPGAGFPLNDEATLQCLLNRCAAQGAQVALLPGSLGARQVKGMIARCRIFVGARTHATIAALSTGVPTVTIAYSQKARGIWRDVFGHERYLLPANALSSQSLRAVFDLLANEWDEARDLLVKKKPEMLAGARENVRSVVDCLGMA